MITASIIFETPKGAWHVGKRFHGRKHMDNFIHKMTSERGYVLDEVYIKKAK